MTCDLARLSAACTVCDLTWPAGVACPEVAAHVVSTGHPVAVARPELRERGRLEAVVSVAMHGGRLGRAA